MCRILFDHVKASYERLSFENVVWVGADEMNRRKGNNYLSVFADLVAKRFLFAKSCNESSVREMSAKELLRHSGHPKSVRYKAIEMIAQAPKDWLTTSGTRSCCMTSLIYSSHSWKRAAKSEGLRAGPTL